MDYKGYTIRIEQDDTCSDSPRDWSNLGVMVCFHTRYALGDKNHGYNFNDYGSWQELKQAIIKKEKPLIILPVYMYDHSGLTINTTGFSCPWDSGQIGFMFATKQYVRDEYAKKRISKQLKERVKTVLINEVEIYDQFLRGDVYGYIIEKNGEHIDSCWGYYGREIAETEAKSIVNYFVKVDAA